jgi:hypothetical protein
MKGTMSEAELHILGARLGGGIRNKAAGRATPGPACRVGVERGRRADPAAPRRGRPRCPRDDLRTAPAARLGPGNVAVAQGARPEDTPAAQRLRPGVPTSSGWSRPTPRCTRCSPTPIFGRVVYGKPASLVRSACGRGRTAFVVSGPPWTYRGACTCLVTEQRRQGERLGLGEAVSQGERVKRLVRVVVRDDLRLGTRYVVLRNLVIEARGLGS